MTATTSPHRGALPTVPHVDIPTMAMQKKGIQSYLDSVHIGDSESTISRSRAQNAVRVSFENLVSLLDGVDHREHFSIMTLRATHTSPLHFHDHHEITYIPYGSMLLITPRSTYVIEKGGCIFIPAGVAHALSPIPDGDDYPIEVDFLFTQDILDSMKTLSAEHHMSEKLHLFPRHSECVLMNPDVSASSSTSTLAPSLHRLMRAYEHAGFHLDFSVMAALFETAHTYNLLTEGALTIPQLQRDMQNVIEEHLSHVTVPFLASSLGFSVGHLSRQIKKLTGHSPGHFILQARLDAAQNYLSRTNLPVERIAELVGYESVSYFYKAFSQKFHQTPAQYRMLFTIE